MRLGISGKGGVGKTTISAVLARTLARRGHTVIAIDCDSDPNLAINCGITEEQFANLKPFLNRGIASIPVGKDPVELLHDYGLTGPDGVTHLLGARIERAGAG
ncbi:MAG: AAA family ATPase [Egibacteraceae bacterium]